YIWRALKDDSETTQEFEDEVSLFAGRPIGFQFALAAAGLGLLVGGAHWMVLGAVHLAREIGVSEWIIGISIVAVGTSLPEIVSSLLAARRGHGEMALGNIFGSNIFNIFMVLGLSAAIKPLKILDNIHPDLLITTGLTGLLLILIRVRHPLDSLGGMVLLVCYFTYIGIKAMGIL
ncbi:MAG: sodium:calcium antiporter, partial [Nitrospinaceae bacterium]|nr:sodium:calcium antiporter [Nitrospinaceae bacterium]NIR55418.1 sodium:calcium antiporter [Nitrospinaceae bacterium]NIS85858.1 sodium:calcium antiporter [Nitrospinaceae bacterium]NIT82702.1 sodium:calcium antiporter [Nitrospinaceae bacterium]NIU44911.1 sodium:calcium antiporter [Nitrospinaceae bacterium]